MGEFHRFTRVIVLTGPGGAFVEGHQDVGPDAALDIHDILRGENMPGAVDMRPENCPFRRQLPLPGKGKNLVPPAVGQDGAVPVHKPVYPPGTPDHLDPGPQEKVVGVPEQDRGLYLIAKVLLADPFYRPRRSHGHEHRGGDVPVTGFQETGSCPGSGVGMMDLEPHLAELAQI